ncbi:putative bifunctional diguanylate cyclase/phosphodiesterase [Blastococcus mobilis]|uniref:PAS domain S-box-containing protein/diguanylate cyclase (GGDEF) domain-containing protein n=1 Tax=Blastococcus mobilis TaxID=1938746 RepID=A0A238WBU9_9ACTN|nr:GGDEF domain-containing phosphodiesterase [Blastococcus mobilis]SNR43851.1 PAS domain S-box-containing protein/diguanylate cyclase (GGDEF) domain-containing protein [Blastococcus mobilis]
MDSRRWWLLAAALPVALGCALAAAHPELRLAGEYALIGAGLVAGGVLWSSAARTARPRTWRLLSAASLLPAAGALLATVVGPADPVHATVLRWVPAVPGYVIAVIAVLGLVDRRRLRSGPRVAVEVGLFLVACLVVVGLLAVGPDGRWPASGLTELLVPGTAVLATSATMAVALTLLGVVEAGRRSMAVLLLVGAVLLTLGPWLGTPALLPGVAVPVGVSRFLVVAGLFALALAVLADSQGTPVAPRDGAHEPRPGGHAGSLLPHLALLMALATCGAVVMAGGRLAPGTIAGLVVCAVLAAVHRWLTACEEQRLEARLRRSEAYFRSVVRSASDAVVVLDDDLRVTWASPALGRALGEAAPALLGRPLLESVHHDDVPALAAVLPVAGAVPAEAPAVSGLLTLRLPDAAGEWRCLEAGVTDLRGDPDVGAVVLHCRDMTERQAREQALQAIAHTDPMTGLPNRAGVREALQRAATDPGHAPTTLLMIQLVGLAAAREDAGRETVTTAMTEVGRRLRATVRGEDTVARMGGGAFAVLAHGADADADRLADRCLSVVEQPIPTPGGMIELTAVVGVVPVEHGLGVDALLDRADLAVRAADEAGPGTARRYQDALGEAAARRDLLRSDLRCARTREELFLLFQPIVSLEQQRITCIEAELRWRHETLGEIPPGDFMPLAERTGLIGDLVRWGLEQAAAAAIDLPSTAAPLRIAMKVPVGHLSGGTLVSDVESALRATGLSPERLVLQISAPAVMSDDERLGLDVSSLRLMGVHVALDGFGGGSSALAHLTRLPIDVVKLDRSLITRIDRDPQSRALCESVIGIGRALGLDVVAEGVETTAQLAALRGFGCDFAQGFVIARPMPLAGIAAMVADGDGVLLPGLAGSR